MVYFSAVPEKSHVEPPFVTRHVGRSLLVSYETLLSTCWHVSLFPVNRKIMATTPFPLCHLDNLSTLPACRAHLPIKVHTAFLADDSCKPIRINYWYSLCIWRVSVTFFHWSLGIPFEGGHWFTSSSSRQWSTVSSALLRSNILLSTMASLSTSCHCLEEFVTLNATSVRIQSKFGAR